jgi:hypothetical protein
MAISKKNKKTIQQKFEKLENVWDEYGIFKWKNYIGKTKGSQIYWFLLFLIFFRLELVRAILYNFKINI